MVVISATFKMCYEHFHSAKLLYSGYLNQILWYKTDKRYLFFFDNFAHFRYPWFWLGSEHSLRNILLQDKQKISSFVINSKHYKTMIESVNSKFRLRILLIHFLTSQKISRQPLRLTCDFGACAVELRFYSPISAIFDPSEAPLRR